MQKLRGMTLSGCFEQISDDMGIGKGASAGQSTSGKVTATYLQHHFSDGPTGAESTRLQIMLGSLKASTAKEVGEAVRDWSNAFKPKAAKGTPEFKAENAKRLTVQSRGSEVKALKAAMDTGYVPEQGKGWHTVISAARATLAEKGLSNSGKPTVDPQERARNREQAEILGNMLKGNSVVTPENFEQKKAEAIVERNRETARKLGNVVVQRHGLDVALYLAEFLTAEAQSIAQALANAEAKEKDAPATALTQDQQTAADSQNGDTQHEPIPQAAAA